MERGAVVIGVAAGIAAHIHRLAPQIARSLGRGHNPGDAAVIDQTVVVQPQRVRNEAACLMLLHGQRLAHHGVRVQHGVLAERHRNVRQVFGT
ncbi:hypothetical protein D3C87_1327360 [compost metagenome]